MFVQSKATTNQKHKNGLCIKQRRGGHETLVQWANGDQRWVLTSDIDGYVQLVGNSGKFDYED